MRLIDADKLHREEIDYFLGYSIQQIENAPTVCDIEQIRAEIDGIEINGQIDEHTMFIRSGEQVKNMTLDIIDKHTK